MGWGLWEAVAAIVSCCGCITALGAVGALIAKIIMPAKKQFDTIKELERRSKLDYEVRKDLEVATKALVKGMIAICRSLESHPEFNAKGEIQEAYEELREYLVKR